MTVLKEFERGNVPIVLPNETVMMGFLRNIAGKNLDTFYHSDRVSVYAGIIAKMLGCSETFIQALRIFCRFHDIGKYEIPDEILNKPSGLNADEWKIMRMHTTLGYEMLREDCQILGLCEISQTLAECLCCLHHERFNGKGYFGKKGKKIPLAARICHLADVFDALTSKRPYRAELPPPDAVRIILEGDNRTSPDDFDPLVLTAFKKALPLFKKARERFIYMGAHVTIHWPPISPYFL